MPSRPPSSLNSIKITYFNIGGRAQGTYFMLEDAGIPYARVLIGPDNRAAYHIEKMEYSRYPFNQIPTFEVNGMLLAQSDAILRFLSRSLDGYAPESPKDQIKVDMLACSLEDMHKAYGGAVYSAAYPDKLLVYIKTTAPTYLCQYECLLSQSEGPEGTFVASEKPCFPEWTLLHLIIALLTLSPSALDFYPLLSTWYGKITSRPNISAYLASGRKPERLQGTPNGQQKVCD